MGLHHRGVNDGKRVGPRYVAPIHDWYLEDLGKGWLYGMAERALAEEGITLLALDDFEAVSVESAEEPSRRGRPGNDSGLILVIAP
jgi:hypothetical protein